MADSERSNQALVVNESIEKEDKVINQVMFDHDYKSG